MTRRRLLVLMFFFVLLLSVVSAKYVDMKINLGGEAIDGFSAEEEILNLDNSETLSKMRYHGDIKRGNPHPNVFKTQRFSRYEDLVLNIPVQDGVYSVSLLFAETWDGAFGPNKRVFDVYIGSQPTGIVKVLSQFDPFREGGAAGGIVKKFTNIATQNGLTIALRPIIQNPQIAGIVIQGYSYSDALLEDLPTVTSHLPPSEDFSVLNNIGPRTPADPSILYDPNSNPKFKNNGGSSSSRAAVPPPAGGAGSVDLSLSSQTSTTQSSGFPGAYGGSTSNQGGFGSGMTGMGGAGAGSEHGAGMGGYGAQGAAKPMNGMGGGYGMGGYGMQSQYSGGSYGQPVYRRRLNSFPEPVEVDFPSSGSPSMTEPSGASFSQRQGLGTGFSGDSNTYNNGGMMGGGSDLYQRGLGNYEGMSQTQGSNQYVGTPPQPMEMQSVPMEHPSLSSETTLPGSSNGFSTSGATEYQTSSGMSPPSVMSDTQRMSGVQGPSTTSHMSPHSMAGVNDEPSSRVPASSNMNEDYGQTLSRGRSISNEYHSGQGFQREPQVPRSGRLAGEPSSTEFEGHGGMRETEGISGKNDMGITRTSTQAEYTADPRNTNGRWMHHEAQAQSEQLQKLSVDGDVLRSERINSLSHTQSEIPNAEHPEQPEHPEQVMSNTVHRGYERDDSHREKDRGLPHMDTVSERTTSRRIRDEGGYAQDHEGRYIGRKLRGRAGYMASQNINGQEEMEPQRGSHGERDMMEHENSRIQTRHVERMATQNGAQEQHEGLKVGEQRDLSGRGGHDFYSSRMVKEGREPRHARRAGRFQGGEDSGLEEGNYPPPPGIHNGVAQLEGICIHNETHCSCGMTDQPTEEPCLVVMNNSTNPMICAESECNGHLVCACAAGANTLCKRTTVNSILVAVPDKRKSDSFVSGFDNNVKLCRRETLEQPIEVLIPML